MKSILAIWLIIATLNIAFWGVLIYIILHFVIKLW